eukprot:6235273-Amphidinium_carterae.1
MRGRSVASPKESTSPSTSSDIAACAVHKGTGQSATKNIEQQGKGQGKEEPPKANGQALLTLVGATRELFLLL